MAAQRATSRHPATSGAADLSAPGDLSSSAASFARYLRAANIAPATLKTYAEAVRTLAGFLAERGMPTDVGTISREHVEAFMTDQLARSRRMFIWPELVRSHCLQRRSRWRQAIRHATLPRSSCRPVPRIPTWRSPWT